MNNIAVGLAIPFLGTTLGSAMVIFMKNKINPKVEKLLLGFASGVMIAASIWSLIIPSLDMAEQQSRITWLPTTIGFMLGVAFLLVIDSLIPHVHLNSDETEGINSKKLSKTTKTMLAVMIHNLPERHDSWYFFCRGFSRKCWNNFSWYICFSNRYCNSKFSRRGYNFDAIKSRGEI